MLDEGLEKAGERAHKLLERWCQDRTPVWVYFATSDAGLASSGLARIAEVARCLVVMNESTIWRADLKEATFRFGPLQVLLAPSRLGRMAAVTQKRNGLVGRDGVIIALESGHSLFICESSGDEREALEIGLRGMLEG